MTTASVQLAAASGLLSLVLFVVAMAVVAVLGGSFWLGARVKSREPPGRAPRNSRTSRRTARCTRYARTGNPTRCHGRRRAAVL